MHGEEGHDQMDGSIFLGKAKTTPNYKKVKLGKDYEALGFGNESIVGELYAVDDEKLNQLDDYEYDIYVRHSVKLSIGRTAQAYFLKSQLDKPPGS